MKTTEISLAKHMQKRSVTAILITVLTLLCIFVGETSFFTTKGTLIAYADEEASSDETVLSDETKSSDVEIFPENTASLACDIIDWKLNTENCDNLQALIDECFCQNPTNGNVMSYIQALIINPNFDFKSDSYTKALCSSLNEAIDSEAGLFPTTLQKAIITLCMCQTASNETSAPDEVSSSFDALLSDKVLNEAFNNTIGQKGIMSYIWGLNMLEACEDIDFEYTCEYTRENIILTLITMQAADGGYSLSGDEGDVDVTAMTLKSLSKYYINNSDYEFTPDEIDTINSSIERSISFLISNQLPIGAYASYGSACSESTAQVILTVAALSLDFSEFINNDNSLLDGLLLYRMPDGSFSHTDSPLVTNDMASAQAFEAISAVCRNYNLAIDFDSIGDMTSVADDEYAVNNSATVNSAADNQSLVNDSLTGNASSASVPSAPANIKLYLYLATAVISLITVVTFTVLFLRDKKRKRFLMRLISVLLVAALCVFAIYSIKIESRDDYLGADSQLISSKASDGFISISFVIDCSTVENDKAVASIYSSSALYVAEGSTVFDILTEICRLNDIQLDYESNSVYGTAYIKGINSLYEYDHGDLSGWMYRVNGEFPSVGCGYYTLSEGDRVEWLYTTNIGRDLEDD